MANKITQSGKTIPVDETIMIGKRVWIGETILIGERDSAHQRGAYDLSLLLRLRVTARSPPCREPL
ncbi:MAG: hypothetical protein N2112_15195 [Gemmataceae bacterium]|nr:hypothetical protein [Gemmataceae bacterium]